MANPARAKGTKWETELLGRLSKIWPAVERAPLKGIQDRGDFVNVPFPVEAKSTKTFLLGSWIPRLRTKAGGGWWVLAYHDDRRLKNAVGDIAVVPLDMLLALLQAAEGVA